MRPPKVPAAMVQQRTSGHSAEEARQVWDTFIVNALPRYYVALSRDGGLSLMEDRSRDNGDGATGPQVCLATIAPEILDVLRVLRAPVELIPHG